MTVQQNSDTAPKPRRLNFTKPDPKPTAPVVVGKAKLTNDEAAAIAREKRALAPERHLDVPRNRPRLPHGAIFEVTFDAERVEWTGSLTVGEIVITSHHGVVMGLLSKLDAKYRAMLSGSV